MTSVGELTSSDRAGEMTRRLRDARARIDEARRAVGRTDDVTLVVVTKTFPDSDVQILADLGVTDIGENRDQEARAKRESVGSPGLRWHMIGQVQRNKAASITRWADVVESVDRLALVDPLSRGAVAANRMVGVLVQVNLDPQARPGRGGVAPAEARSLADALAAAPGLELRGVMGVAPGPGDGGDAESAFALLADLHALIRADHPQAGTISAGMSGDLEQAIAHGATQVRVGGAILGSRPYVQ
jgi:pyridoxal phosphate enzyme (YggS family)